MLDLGPRLFRTHDRSGRTFGLDPHDDGDRFSPRLDAIGEIRVPNRNDCPTCYQGDGACALLSTRPGEIGDTLSRKLAGQSLYGSGCTEESPGSAEQDAG